VCCQSEDVKGGGSYIHQWGQPPLKRYAGRYGVNNATINGGLLKSTYCPLLVKAAGSTGTGSSVGKVAWVSTHYPLTHFFADAHPNKVYKFNHP
jgi:hypothetical protein